MSKKKWEFKKIGLDNYELHYFKGEEEEVIPFKTTVQLYADLENCEASARLKMYEYLTQNGKTKSDLIIEKKGKNGEIIVDETNYKEFEKSFIDIERYHMLEKIYTSLFNKTIQELTKEIDLNEDEAFRFGSELGLIMQGSDTFPSNTKQLPTDTQK